MRNSRMVPGVSFLTSRYRCIIGVSRGSSAGLDMDECRYGKVHRRGAEDAEKRESARDPGIEDADLLPLRLVLFDELHMVGDGLVGVVRLFVLEVDVERDVVHPVVHG